MSWYRMVDVRLHGDAKFLRLSPEQPSGRALFKHLLICPENGPLPGVIRAGAAALAEALEWLPEPFRERFGELFRERLADADWKARIVFLPNGIKYNPPANPNTVLGWQKHWDALPECALKTQIWHRYHEYFQADAAARREEISSGERDGRQDPDALLKAFLRALPAPPENGYGNPVETVTRTVPGTVTDTVPGTVCQTVDDISAGARARLPEPEQQSNSKSKSLVGHVGGEEQFTLTMGEPPPDPDDVIVERIWGRYLIALEKAQGRLKLKRSVPKLSKGNRELVLACLRKTREKYDDAEDRMLDAVDHVWCDPYHMGALPKFPGARLTPLDVFKINGKIDNIEKLCNDRRAAIAQEPELLAWLIENLPRIEDFDPPPAPAARLPPPAAVASNGGSVGTMTICGPDDPIPDGLIRSWPDDDDDCEE